MKLLLDFLPIILFFTAYRFANADKEGAAAFATEHFGFLVSGGKVGPDEASVLLATVVVIVATLVQVALLKVRGKKVDLMLWVSLVLVVVLGGATIWFHNKTFIMWKPSVLYWTMGLAFWVAQLLGKNLLRVLLGDQIELPDPIWQRLNAMWIAFFGVMGLLNIWVAKNFSEATWVNFKLFGGVGLMLLFTLAQGIYLSRHLKHDEAEPTVR